MRQLSIYLAMIDEPEDRQKFEQLYNAYNLKLQHYASRLLSQYPHLAEDAVSETFLDVAKNMHRIGEPVSERTAALLMLTLQHRAIDLARRERRHSSRRTDYNQQIEENIPMAPAPDDSGQSGTLAEALALLPSPYREVILLKYAEGYSNEEIAGLLNLTVVNVKKIITRGKKKLRNIREEAEKQ